jgi:hypothetical protein
MGNSLTLKHYLSGGTMFNQEIFDGFAASLPQAFPRAELARLTAGLVTGRSFANLQSEGKAPRGCIVGGKNCLTRAEFLDWLKGQIKGEYPETPPARRKRQARG